MLRPEKVHEVIVFVNRKQSQVYLNYAEARKGPRSEPGVNPRLSRSSELRYGS